MATTVFLLFIVKLSHSQSNNNTNTGDTVIRSFCDRVDAMSPLDFFRNLNSTFAALRRQLSMEGVHFARAQNLGHADSVYGTAQCRQYLPTGRCITCIDVGVSTLARCTSGNGAYAILDDCFLRYQNYGDYYDDPTIIEDVGQTAVGVCSEESSSEPTTFNKFVQEFLSDIRIATPRTSDFYVSSTRKSSSGNVTLYAIAQCVENTTQRICQSCLNRAYNNLYGCLPHTEGKAIDLGCFMRYSDTPFFKDNQTTNIIPFLKEGSSRKVGMLAAVTVCIGIFLLILVISLWYRLHRRSKSHGEEIQEAVNYSYKDIQLATGNFSEEYRVGKGGFGEVYKAIIDEKHVVAVKKLLVRDGRARIEFDNEVKMMSCVRHRNLVRVLGWSSEGPELLLVLEYMPKGSLDKFLWGEQKGSLNWKQRYDMIFGIARGLAHLHHEFHVKIIHRDIKSANILLDDDFQPKIADFGLARFQQEDQSHVSTKFAGTLGYTAPEYATHGHLSEKVDTYSFGIVTLEIISGRRCTDVNSQRPDMYYLLEDAWKLYENNMHPKLIDETLDLEEGEEEHVKKIIEIGLTCTQSPVGLRPTMSEVVLLLSNGRSLVRRKVGSKSTLTPGSDD
ncbi:cysteine-rich receptor-like protein kinase 2 [Cynara cardunculus var. scolymus]|uniref:cysteine-rich receptor-like protein kinase 2 n=1 Tax=Cynara cardunculus var. scolymus TaxID=59895 RepID=UPI000D62685B|nr:cysteine-rich receptor-like protein kinase 2 [Cynara cardunculus var. scolymus]